MGVNEKLEDVRGRFVEEDLARELPLGFGSKLFLESRCRESHTNIVTEIGSYPRGA